MGAPPSAVVLAGTGALRAGCRTSPPQSTLLQDYSDVQISSLGLERDAEVRRVLRRALRDAWPAARRNGWRPVALCELEPGDRDVGYTAEDGTIFVKVRHPTQGHSHFYPYSFVLATLLHELTHLSHLGHGKAFYHRLVEAAAECGAEPAVRCEVRSHICAELLNAVCDNDARRARALLAALPEAVACRPGAGRPLPLEYAAHHGRVALTRLLLEARADADASGADGVPPLARAAARGNSKTAMLLLAAGATCGRALLEAPMPTAGSAPAVVVPAVASCIGARSTCNNGDEDELDGGGRGSSRWGCVQQRPRSRLRQGYRLLRAHSLPALAAATACRAGEACARPHAPAPKWRAVTLSGSLAL